MLEIYKVFMNLNFMIPHTEVKIKIVFIYF